MVVRISVGHFDPSRSNQVTNMLDESSKSLTPAIHKLSGLIHYYVGLDREKGYMTNTSLWETHEDAMQMATLPEMLALQSQFEALGIEFIPISNHEVLWTVEPKLR